MDNVTPKNLQELLKFALKQQQRQSGESNCVEVKIDGEKKEFLDQVLKSMSVDITKEFLKAISILQGSTSDQEKIEALDIIRDYVDDIDFANNFIKIEGADILLSHVKHENHDVCISALKIVAEMSQNNAVCQEYFLKHGIIEVLTGYLSNNNPNVVASALYAVSALTQHFEPALAEFIKFDGIKLVANCLYTDCIRVFSRSCTLITSMSSASTLVKDKFAQLDVINILRKRLRIVVGFDIELEMGLRALSVLVESRYCQLKEAETKHIIDILQGIVNNNKNNPDCEEIVVFSNCILDHLNSKFKHQAFA